MKRIVIKEVIPDYSRTDLILPTRAKVIHVGLDCDKKLCLWFEADVATPTVHAAFVVVPTGGWVPDKAVHVGSTVTPMWVWHVYQLPA